MGKQSKLVAAIVLGCAVGAPGGAFADGASSSGETCKTRWWDAPAADVCEGSSVPYTLESNPDLEMCRVNAVCSVTIEINSKDDAGVTTSSEVTFNPSVANTLPKLNVPRLTLCFEPDTSDDTYDIEMKTRCGTDETDLETAVADGLQDVAEMDDEPSPFEGAAAGSRFIDAAAD